MQITSETLSTIIDSEDGFVTVFKRYTEEVLRSAVLIPVLSKLRLKDAYGSWKNDLARVGDNEKHLTEGLDHFKQAGHLAFWLRRMSPLIEAYEIEGNYQDGQTYDVNGLAIDFRRLLFAYGNEYLAFDFAFQIVSFYEHSRSDRTGNGTAVRLSRDYYETICHFLKFKNVSPHALHLIYKSLFNGNVEAVQVLV